MNVFFIPSWYPSETDPLPGIFFRNQALAISRHQPNMHIGISHWGQNDERLLLWGRQPVRSIYKRFIQEHPVSSYSIIADRVTEYFYPAFTWTSRIMQGNMKNIILSNRKNLELFQKHHGKTAILHAHVGYPAGHIARALSHEFSIPYVITEHMSPFPHLDFIKNDQLLPGLRDAYAHAARNIAISGALAKSMQYYGIPNISVIPNPVDEQFFQPADRQPEKQHFTFFSLGRMVPQKGIDILLRAFGMTSGNMTLRIGGDGPFLETYKKLALDLEINERIGWLGALDQHQVRNEMQRCDAFVLPSRHESMGVVFVEAMACGKPVIGTICGGPEEFIDEQTGILVERENIQALANAMKKMVHGRASFDPGIIRKRFEERFSFSAVSRMIIDAYQSVINSGKNNGKVPLKGS